MGGVFDDLRAELRARDDEVGHHRVGAIIDERRAVDPRGVKARAECNRGGRTIVPLMLAAGVIIEIGIAGDDRFAQWLDTVAAFIALRLRSGADR